MLKATLIVKDNWRTMMKIEKKVKDGSGQGCKNTAEAIVADIRSSWSAIAPSAWGNPPAIETSNLDSAVHVEGTGRDDKGRFTDTENSAAFFIQVNTEDGVDPRGRGNYAAALEDETYLNRQFLSPALERAFGTFAQNIKQAVDLE